MRVKKILVGKGQLACVKEVLGRNLDTESGIVTLPERNLWELLTLVDIPATQRWMRWKDLERLLRKLHPMQLAVPGAVAHLFHI